MAAALRPAHATLEDEDHAHDLDIGIQGTATTEVHNAHAALGFRRAAGVPEPLAASRGFDGWGSQRL